MSLELDAIKARADKATPAPWYRVGPPWNTTGSPWINAGSPDPHQMQFVCDLDADMAGVEREDGTGNELADAEFIAHAREDVPALLAEVERLRAAVASVRVLAEQADEYGLCLDTGASLREALGGAS